MPYMQRLTNGGVALHGGRVPGYRASHGCIRLPHRFARRLYGLTDHGTPVIVTRARPRSTADALRLTL
jgi:lipoprotein-anchoring transpeptidase ErfK/SrfK